MIRIYTDLWRKRAKAEIRYVFVVTIEVYAINENFFLSFLQTKRLNGVTEITVGFFPWQTVFLLEKTAAAASASATTTKQQSSYGTALCPGLAG